MLREAAKSASIWDIRDNGRGSQVKSRKTEPAATMLPDFSGVLNLDLMPGDACAKAASKSLASKALS